MQQQRTPRIARRMPRARGQAAADEGMEGMEGSKHHWTDTQRKEGLGVQLICPVLLSSGGVKNESRQLK